MTTVRRAAAPPRLPRQSGVRAPQQQSREQLVEQHLPLVRGLAARYRNLGEPFDDLVQVGTIGLIQAVDRYEPERGVPLAGYATSYILGEIRRHLRDRSRAVRIPRQVHDVQSRVTAATADLVQHLRRAPTVSEIAAASGVDLDLVVETLEVRRACRPLSLDTTTPDGRSPGDAASGTLTDAALVHDESALDDVVHRESLRPVLAGLDEREKRILVLRFFRGLSQRQIAAELGISQMHVSRLLTRTLERIRAQVTAEE